LTTVVFTIKIIIFILSTGYFFTDLFRKNALISIFAGMISIASGFYTFKTFYEEFNKKSEENVSNIEKQDLAKGLGTKASNPENLKKLNTNQIIEEKAAENEIISLYKSGKLSTNLDNLLNSYPWLENKLKEINDFKSFKEDKQFEINQKLNELSIEEQSLIKKALEKPSLSESYLKYLEYDLNEQLFSFFEMMKVFGDLNNDGIPELVFDYPAYCGSGGCTFPIYQINIKDETVNYIGYTSDTNIENSIAKDKINGWYPIIYEHRIGPTYYETLLVFEDGKYIEKGTLENNLNEKGDMYEVKNGDKIIKYTPINLSEQQ
jgi:hypothetical protein